MKLKSDEPSFERLRGLIEAGAPQKDVLGELDSLEEELVAEKTHLETDLKGAHKQYQAFFEGAQDGIFVANEKFKVVNVNPAYCRMYGFDTPDQALNWRKKGWDVASNIHPDDMLRVSEYMKNLIEHPDQVGSWIEHRSRRVDGEYIWVSSSNEPILDASRKLIGMRGILRDITEKKSIEEELKQSEQRFEAIFDNALDGILLADAENKSFLIGNKSICQMLGYTYEEIRGLEVMDIHPEERMPYVLEQFEKQSRGEIMLAQGMPMRRKDGSVFYADINSTPIELSGRKYLLGVFRDITERKRAEQERERLLSFLRHDLGNFFGSVSNSIYFIRTKFDQWKGNPGSVPDDCSAKVEKHFDIISANERRLRDFLKAFSNYSHDQTDEYVFSRCDVGELLNSTILALSNELDGVHVKVINDLDGLEVVCDEAKIARLWENYLTNAIKYSKGKEYDNLVKVGFVDEGAVYRFHVKDNGIGISSDDITKLSTPYTRLHTKRADGTSIEGTGLGLASIEEVVRRHGGTTKIESEGEGKGATFYFTLPKNVRAGPKP